MRVIAMLTTFGSSSNPVLVALKAVRMKFSVESDRGGV